MCTVLSLYVLNNYHGINYAVLIETLQTPLDSALFNKWIPVLPSHTVKVFTTNIRIHPEKVKVKQSLYKPVQALRVSGDSGSQISRESANESGQIASPTHRPLFSHQEILLVLISVTG
jgi:hypothetical protein